MTGVSPHPRTDRFFDPDTGGPLCLVLASDVGGSTFALRRRIGFHDGTYDEPFIVPADDDTLEAFRTDLTSVPWFFLWLVPRVGEHLPAAVLHDGLVETSLGGRSYSGPRVEREEADHIFRRAMAVSGVRLVRRWLVWTAVTFATMWRAVRPYWRWRGVLLLTALLIAGLGSVATLDLLDVVAVLPWMGERPWWVELATGAVAAVLVPAALSLTWGRFRAAGLIGGVALALLLHVTVAVMAVYGLYRLLELVLGTFDTGRDQRV